MSSCPKCGAVYEGIHHACPQWELERLRSENSMLQAHAVTEERGDTSIPAGSIAPLVILGLVVFGAKRLYDGLRPHALDVGIALAGIVAAFLAVWLASWLGDRKRISAMLATLMLALVMGSGFAIYFSEGHAHVSVLERHEQIATVAFAATFDLWLVLGVFSIAFLAIRKATRRVPIIRREKTRRPGLQCKPF